MIDRLSSYTGIIVWELAWVDLTMFVLGEWLGLEEFEFLVHIILCASCKLLVRACTTKKTCTRQYFSVSHAPYCTQYRKDLYSFV